MAASGPAPGRNIGSGGADNLRLEPPVQNRIPAEPVDHRDAAWEGARRQLLEATLAATPAQRLVWLEEMLELAYRAGALETKPTGQET